MASRKTTTPQDKAQSTVGKVAGKSASSATKAGKGASPLTKAVTERVQAAASNAKSAVKASAAGGTKAAAPKAKATTATKAAAAPKKATTATKAAAAPKAKATTATKAAAAPKAKATTATKAAAAPKAKATTATKAAAAPKAKATAATKAAAAPKAKATAATKAAAAPKAKATAAAKAAAAPKAKAASAKASTSKGVTSKTVNGVAEAKERKQKIVPASGPEHEAALAAAHIAADAALDKKAENVLILDVAGLNSYADCFVIASGSSDRQVSAIADAIEEKMKKAGHKIIGVEGHGLGHWILLDYADVVIHVFYEEVRGHYDVEGLWSDAKRIQVG